MERYVGQLGSSLGSAPHGAGNEPESPPKIRDRLMRARNPAAQVLVIALAALLQCPDPSPPHSHVLRTLRRLRTPAGARHDPARHGRPRPRPNTKGGAH